MNQAAGDFVKILETRDHGMIATAKSLLDGAGIDYAVNNEFGQTIGLHPFSGGAQIWVRPGDADMARHMLSGLVETAEAADEQPVVDQPADIELATPADLASIPPPQPERPFIFRLLWLIVLLLVPLILVIIYSMRH